MNAQNKNDKGIQGDQGPQGVMGPSGEIGPIGPAGPAGGIGPAGPAGGIGPIGPVGPVGPVGPAGGAAVRTLSVETTSTATSRTEPANQTFECIYFQAANNIATMDVMFKLAVLDAVPIVEIEMKLPAPVNTATREERRVLGYVTNAYAINTNSTKAVLMQQPTAGQDSSYMLLKFSLIDGTNFTGSDFIVISLKMMYFSAI